MSYCEHPECSKRVQSHNVSRMCKDHLHDAEHCRCVPCTRRRAKPKGSERTDVRVFTTRNSFPTATAEVVRITLPKEPWA